MTIIQKRKNKKRESGNGAFPVFAFLIQASQKLAITSPLSGESKKFFYIQHILDLLVGVKRVPGNDYYLFCLSVQG